LITAYNTVFKYTAKGLERLKITQFNYAGLDMQINTNVLNKLKEEEWLLERIGLSTMQKHNLLPTKEEPVKTRDVYEAFLRFDDKPMITGVGAVQNSILKFCSEKSIAIASGDRDHFTQYWLGETPPFFDAQDDNSWLVEITTVPQKENIPSDPNPQPNPQPNPNPKLEPVPDPRSKKLHRISISGKIPVENYNQIFTSFINPLRDNHPEVEIIIRAKSTVAKELFENSMEINSIKESAKQLGLDLSIE